MSENTPEQIPTVFKARSSLARLHNGNPDIPEATLKLARTNLACAKIDNRIREYMAMAGARMNASQTSHLIGLLLMEAGVPGATVTLFDSMVRSAVNDAQADA